MELIDVDPGVTEHHRDRGHFTPRRQLRVLADDLGVVKGADDIPHRIVIQGLCTGRLSTRINGNAIGIIVHVIAVPVRIISQAVNQTNYLVLHLVVYGKAKVKAGMITVQDVANILGKIRSAKVLINDFPPAQFTTILVDRNQPFVGLACGQVASVPTGNVDLLAIKVGLVKPASIRSIALGPLIIIVAATTLIIRKAQDYLQLTGNSSRIQLDQLVKATPRAIVDTAIHPGNIRTGGQS